MRGYELTLTAQGNPIDGKNLNGGRCWKGFGYKVVTKGCLEALVLKGGDGGACKLLGRLLGDVIEVLEVLGC
ncbi:hypothetical protein Tco_0719136 [Tanacetum coccineum]